MTLSQVGEHVVESEGIRYIARRYFDDETDGELAIPANNQRVIFLGNVRAIGITGVFIQLSTAFSGFDLCDNYAWSGSGFTLRVQDVSPTTVRYFTDWTLPPGAPTITQSVLLLKAGGYFPQTLEIFRSDGLGVNSMPTASYERRFSVISIPAHPSYIKILDGNSSRIAFTVALIGAFGGFVSITDGDTGRYVAVAVKNSVLMHTRDFGPIVRESQFLSSNGGIQDAVICEFVGLPCITKQPSTEILG